MSEADFALQWLNYLGIKVYNKGKQVLVYEGEPDYEITPLDTHISVGEALVEEKEGEEDKPETMSFSELNENGFTIKAAHNPDWFWKKGQRVFYVLSRMRIDTQGITYEAFRKAGIEIEHDVANRRVRIRGENVLGESARVDCGISDWVYYSEDREVQRRVRPKRKISWEESVATGKKLYGSSMRSGATDTVEIKELPFMISVDKYIVCLKKRGILQRILVVGRSGSGKSFCVNSMASRLQWKWEDRLGWLIDPLNQYQDISMPQEVDGFIRTISILGEEPRPVPAVQLYLASSMNMKFKHPNISFLLTLDFDSLIKRWEFFTYGLKDTKINSLKYMQEFAPKIKNIKSEDELVKIMWKEIPDIDKNQGKQQMVYSWSASFKTLFSKKFTSNLYQDNPDACSELTIEIPDKENEGQYKTMTGHPFIMLYEAGAVPVLNNSSCANEEWTRNYLADLMDEIVKRQKWLGEDAHRVWIIADELNTIYELGKRQNNASAAFERLFRQGRINKIGFIGNTQSLDKLNPEMYKNCTHMFCVKIQSAKERRMIGEIFQLEKEEYEQLGRLKEREMMVISDEPWVIYDRWGRREESTRKWFRGQIIPPLVHHYSPKK